MVTIVQTSNKRAGGGKADNDGYSLGDSADSKVGMHGSVAAQTTVSLTHTTTDATTTLLAADVAAIHAALVAKGVIK